MFPSNNSNSSEDTASSSNNNSISNNAANNDAENSAAEASNEENKRLTSSLQMKFRNYDSAASTLHRLLSYQTRNLLDLRYPRNSIRSSTALLSKHSQSELQALESKLHFTKVE